MFLKAARLPRSRKSARRRVRFQMRLLGSGLLQEYVSLPVIHNPLCSLHTYEKLTRFLTVPLSLA